MQPNVTITLTQEDARVLRQQIDAWMVNPQGGTTANSETREALKRAAAQFRYLQGDQEQEQTQRARG